MNFFVEHLYAVLSAAISLGLCLLGGAGVLAWRYHIGLDTPLNKKQKSWLLIAMVTCVAMVAGSQSAPVQSAVGQIVGTQGYIAVFNAVGRQIGSPVLVDASQFTTLTGSGAEDVCAEAVAAEASIISGNGSAGYVLVPVPRKAYCSEMPIAANFRGQIYFRGRSNRARIYTGVQWGSWVAGVSIFGVGQTGSTILNNTSNTILIACSPLLHDNTYPTNPDGAPCAAYFNSSTNMPQQTISSTTAASGGTATITLSGALSGTPPSVFVGRVLCTDPSTVEACWEIKSVAGNVYTVNSTTMTLCSSSCGTAYLDTPLVVFSQGPTNGATFYHAGMEHWTLDCALVYACAVFANGAGEEGTYLNDIQGYNATAYGFRLFVGNNASPNAYGGDKGGASHSGPYTRIFFNYQSETCEIHTGGCYGTNTNVSGGAIVQYISGDLLTCGSSSVMPATTDAVIAYSSSVAASTCQKTFVGFISDGIAMGTNSQSIYGVNGTTMSLKDALNTGTHARMPELTEGIGIFVVGPVVTFNGYHVEYALICQEIGGLAANNETWIEDGATQIQGATFISGDSNNCTTRNFDLGSAQGTSNVMQFVAINLQSTNGSLILKNNIQANADCTVAAEVNIYYTFVQTSLTTPVLMSDCSSVLGQSLPNLKTSYTATGAVTIGSGSSIPATSLCATSVCPAGRYRVDVYIEITTACTTTGSTIPWLGYTDDQGAKAGSSTTTYFANGGGLGVTPATNAAGMTLVPISTSDFLSGSYFLTTTGVATGGLGSINYGITNTACGSGGPMVGKAFFDVTRLE